jgi:hypothetical protein
MDQLPLVNFKNNRVRIFDKFDLLWGENFDCGKRGSFFNI